MLSTFSIRESRERRGSPRGFRDRDARWESVHSVSRVAGEGEIRRDLASQWAIAGGADGLTRESLTASPIGGRLALATPRSGRCRFQAHALPRRVEAHLGS